MQPNATNSAHGFILIAPYTTKNERTGNPVLSFGVLCPMPTRHGPELLYSSRFCLISERLHLIMHALHTCRLTSHDFVHRRWQRTRKRFLVGVFRNIFSVFQPIEHSMIIAA